jgi:hypothetical protein
MWYLVIRQYASVRHSEVNVADASIPDSGELKTGDRLREVPA